MVTGLPCVQLEGIRVRFGQQVAVDGLDLEIPVGSLCGIIGPNGSGKTTTLRTILRIYVPESGRVVVFGEHAATQDNRRIGYLPEERGLYRRMTVRRVLRYFAHLKQVPRPDEAIDRALAELDAEGWDRKRIEQLSKGMAQKIQFIAATLGEPDLLILDEPFSGLDPVAMDVLRQAIRRLQRAGKTILLSTHDMAIAEQLCDRVVMIFRGRKVLDGSLEEIQQDHRQTWVQVGLPAEFELPDELPGVIARRQVGRMTELQLTEPQMRPVLLRHLTHCVDVERFVTVRPSLHDIFVQIAGPQAAAATAGGEVADA
jgi:ABC-2 type transport system ATP-binding protein